jgi:A/G-specific adenine glycosylase
VPEGAARDDRALTWPALRAWYEPRRTAYPWRRRPTPYRVLVSEVMLQQTQAARVAPAFERFIRRFPSAGSLASASRAEVVRAWAGLGYNRRAVALHEAARRIVRDHRGRVPRAPAALRPLPGIGPYTAAAVAAIGHGVPVIAPDVNVRRVVARAKLGREPTEVPTRVIERAAGRWLGRRDPATWHQALMDLGRQVCRPAPRCSECPISFGCGFRASGRSPAGPVHRQGRFEGSFRQVRGRVLALVRDGGTASFGSLVRLAAEPADRVVAAVRALAADGLLWAGPAALAGRPRGRVGLPV